MELDWFGLAAVGHRPRELTFRIPTTTRRRQTGSVCASLFWRHDCKRNPPCGASPASRDAVLGSVSWARSQPDARFLFVSAEVYLSGCGSPPAPTHDNERKTLVMNLPPTMRALEQTSLRGPRDIRLSRRCTDSGAAPGGGPDPGRCRRRQLRRYFDESWRVPGTARRHPMWRDSRLPVKSWRWAKV